MERNGDLYRDKYWNTPFLLVATFFYTIAGTIGGGLMILPVEASDAGFWAFPLISLLPVLAEIFGAIIFIQIMQKARKHLVKESSGNHEETTEHEYEPVPNNDTELLEVTNHQYSKNENHLDELSGLNECQPEDGDSQDSMTEVLIPKKQDDTKMEYSSDLISKAFFSSGIDLHTIGRLYFKWYYVIFIDLLLFLGTFPFNYVNGVAQTIAVIGLSDENSVMTLTQTLSPIISVLGFVFVFFGGAVIEFLVCGLSFLSASLIMMVVGLALAVLSPFSSTFNILSFSRIFFSETMMIAGSVFLIPQVFSKLRPTKWNVIFFTISVILGLIVTQVICFVWAFAVWGIVPQDGSDGSEVNLRRSQEEGDLSNVPFKLILKRDYPGMSWLGFLVEAFTLLSFALSFIIQCSVMKSVMDGYIKEVAQWGIRKFTRRNNDYLQRREEVLANRNQHHQHHQRRIRRSRWRIKLLVFGFQVASYVIMASVVTILCYTLYSAQYFITEFLGLVDVLVYLFFVVGLGVVDVLFNPFRVTKVWWKIPRWIFILMCAVQGVYYLGFALWYFVYNFIQIGYSANGAKIPF